MVKNSCKPSEELTSHRWMKLVFGGRYVCSESWNIIVSWSTVRRRRSQDTDSKLPDHTDCISEERAWDLHGPSCQADPLGKWDEITVAGNWWIGNSVEGDSQEIDPGKECAIWLLEPRHMVSPVVFLRENSCSRWLMFTYSKLHRQSCCDTNSHSFSLCCTQ
jgi:hypothetical protein